MIFMSVITTSCGGVCKHFNRLSQYMHKISGIHYVSTSRKIFKCSTPVIYNKNSHFKTKVKQTKARHEVDVQKIECIS